MDALIIKKPWIDYIIDGKKVWEIRGAQTKKRGKIGLIQSGSGLIIGCCDLIDCFEINLEDYKQSVNKHCISQTNFLPYKKTYAWVLSNAQRFKNPQKYIHPKGAIIWVKLKNETIQ